MILLKKTSNWVRGLAVGLFIASFACPQLHADSANKVLIGLAGAQFGNGKSIKRTSEPWNLNPSTVYYYKIAGQWRGIGALSNALPPNTPIAEFLEKIKPGSSSILSGSYSNPDSSGALPTVTTEILRKVVQGSKTYPGLGRVNVKLTVKILLAPDGLVTFVISNFKITDSTGTPIPGSVRFGKGTKIRVATTPIEA